MTVVVGTAGHIDHGKTALLRALTGIDADRLPEERQRGMTIDVGYAHLALPDGTELDFVDVPGHDRLVGNMLVGAGEIDAVMLVIAADGGPMAQTHEHLGLLDALGIDDGVAVLTKLDLLDPADPRRRSRPDEVRALLTPTTLAGIPIVAVSAESGEGLDALRTALAELQERVARRGPAPGGPRLAIDRVFSVRGRGVVVTGSLRGGAIASGQSLRLEPGGRTVRVRAAQVHGGAVEVTPAAGRVALNLAAIERHELGRGMALVAGPAVQATARLLVAVRPSIEGRPLTDGAVVRVHLGTAETLGRLRLPPGGGGADASGPEVGAIILERPVAAALDDRFVLRRPSPAETLGGGRILDAQPPARLARRRLDAERLAALADATSPPERLAALVRAHGALTPTEAAAVGAALGAADGGLAELAGAPSVRRLGSGQGERLVDAGVVDAAESAVLDVVAARLQAAAADAVASPASLPEARSAALVALRRAAPGAPLSNPQAAAIVDGLIARGLIVREDDGLRLPGRPAPTRDPALDAAMRRLVDALDAVAPPGMAEAARLTGCPAAGIRALEAEGRIIRVGDDLAYAADAFAALQATAVAMAADRPLTPAAFRDATGTSRKYALAVLEELDGRGILRRGPEGHVLGPRAR